MAGQIVVVPLRVNVNLKACTVEDLIKRRKVGRRARMGGGVRVLCSCVSPPSNKPPLYSPTYPFNLLCSKRSEPLPTLLVFCRMRPARTQSAQPCCHGSMDRFESPKD